jgi:hypothetical protein
MTMKPTLPAIIALGLVSNAGISHAQQLEIDAGEFARDASVITVPIPNSEPGPLDFHSMSGTPGARGQVSQDHILTLISPKLAAGEKVRLSPIPFGSGVRLERATATQNGDQVKFAVRETPPKFEAKDSFTYQGATRKDTPAGLDPKFLRGGYLHPLTTPSGKVVTDDYPKNHLHHHGIWMAWTKAVVDGRETDFWNMGQGKGKVDFVSMEKSWSGAVEAGVIAKNKYTDLTSGSPVDVLGDTWTVKTYAVGDAYRMIDLESDQVTLDGKTLELPIYHYGGIGIRGLEAWNGKGDAATFLNSEGETDRIKANGQPARWVRMTGKVEGGGVAGIAVLCHPDNFRAPQPARIHPNEPFISYAPQTNGAMAIKPGETYKSRYRFIISDGEADAALLERLWQDYAHPITAKWVK